MGGTGARREAGREGWRNSNSMSLSAGMTTGGKLRDLTINPLKEKARKDGRKKMTGWDSGGTNQSKESRGSS